MLRVPLVTAERSARLTAAINTIGMFCGPRSIPSLTQSAIYRHTGTNRVDAMVLFGGSILHGVDMLARAMNERVAKRYIIVGGVGHTTQTLRDMAHQVFPSVAVEGRSEARIFDDCLHERYGLRADWLETESTNCGNNITNLLDLLHNNMPDCQSVILSQDATMQRRMTAGMHKFAPDMTVIDYATYQVKVRANSTDDTLSYDDTDFPVPEGMWTIERYINLLMGEVARLTDNEYGYGPKGRGFIAHVDVPRSVTQAARTVSDILGDMTREANPAYASA